MATKVVDLGKVTGPAGPQGPAGAVGPQGSTGPAGAAGKSAYQQAVAGGYKGTEAEFQAILGSGPWLPKSGGTMTGDIDVIEGKKIKVKRLEMVSDIIGHPDSALSLNPNGFPLIIDGWMTMYGNRLMDLPSPTDPDDAANKAYVDGKMLVFTDKSTTSTAWAADTTYSAQGYAYRASVTCAGVTTSYRPDVTFSVADALSDNFAPVADSYNGGVYIYAKTRPTVSVLIPSIVCVKGA